LARNPPLALEYVSLGALFTLRGLNGVQLRENGITSGLQYIPWSAAPSVRNPRARCL